MSNAAKHYVAARNIIDSCFDDYIRAFIKDEALLAKWIKLHSTDKDLLRSEIAQAIYQTTFDEPIRTKVLKIAGELIQPEDIISALFSE
jgi:hypothetical protein